MKNYGPGEALDRLSILALKILFGTEAGKDTTHFRNEQVLLLTEVKAQNHMTGWLEDAVALAAVNAALWHAEDDLRALRSKVPSTVTEEATPLAFRIQTLNDQRAALVASINKTTGNHVGVEKSHVVPD